MSGGGQTYFQKGFNLKAVVRPVLAQSYHSKVVERLKELGYSARAGDVRIKLAREFGFCYGVDRAVEYAYETREQFPDRRIFLSGGFASRRFFACTCTAGASLPQNRATSIRPSDARPATRIESSFAIVAPLRTAG